MAVVDRFRTVSIQNWNIITYLPNFLSNLERRFYKHVSIYDYLNVPTPFCSGVGTNTFTMSMTGPPWYAHRGLRSNRELLC